MDDTSRSMAEQGIRDTIFLAEKSFVVFTLLDVVNLHGAVTLRRKK